MNNFGAQKIVSDAITVADVIRLVMNRCYMPLHPFEPIDTAANHRLPNFEKRIDTIITNGYPISTVYLFKLDQPLPWQHTDRTVAFKLQAFEPLSPLLIAYSMTKREDCIQLALAYLGGWLQHIRPPIDVELLGKWQEDKKKDFIWYDMSVGLRSYRLAYIIDILMHAKEPDETLLLKLLEILEWHRQIMMRDETFSAHNNHGLYQALGQVAMARRFQDFPGMREALAQGEQRLDAMLKQQFFESGVHREHSPGYHWMILGTLQEALRSGLLHTDEHKLLLSRIEGAMSWFIAPNLLLPTFGDTNAGSIGDGYYKARDITHPHLRFVLSQGRLGAPLPERLKIYHDAGYAILRSYTQHSSTQETYLAQLAGFHSPTHKHADHLTFVWHDKGEDILVDTGHIGYKGKTERGSELWQQGFWYSDPKRIYVEKTCAHNTVEIDRKDFQRRKATFFGSALRRAANINNKVFAIESECKHFQTIRHTRILFIGPGQFLIVFDWLKDNTNKLHDFRQWFHLGATLDLMAQEDPLIISKNGKPFASVMPLLPDIGLESLVRGQPEPDLNGWVADVKGTMLMPNWAFAYGGMQRSQVIFSTLFSLYPDAKPWQTNRVATSGQRGTFTWQDSAGYHELNFSRLPDEEFTLQYRC